MSGYFVRFIQQGVLSYSVPVVKCIGCWKFRGRFLFKRDLRLCENFSLKCFPWLVVSSLNMTKQLAYNKNFKISNMKGKIGHIAFSTKQDT